MDGICSRGAGCLLATGEASSAPTTARSSLDRNEDSTGEMVTTSGRRGAPRAPASQWQHDQTGVCPSGIMVLKGLASWMDCDLSSVDDAHHSSHL
jgi:hypothetical protein